MRRFLTTRSSARGRQPGSMTEKPGNARHYPISRTPSPQPAYTYNHRGERVVHEESPEDDDQSTAALLAPSTPPPPPSFKIKRVDYFYSSWTKTWKYRNTSSKVKADTLKTVGQGTSDWNDPWQTYCFVVVRKLPQNSDDGEKEKFQIVVKSPYLLVALKDVIGKVQGVSWTAEPLELDPHLLLMFLPRFEQYRSNLEAKRGRSTEENHVLKTVGVLIDYLKRDYSATLAKIANLTSHREITFDTLFAIFLPRTIVVADCPVTGEPRAFRLISDTELRSGTGLGAYDLVCESIDVVDDAETSSTFGAYGAGMFNPAVQGAPAPFVTPGIAPSVTGTVDEGLKAANGKTHGKVQSRMIIPWFKGTVPIKSLNVYPIEYHPNPGKLRDALIARGKKWVSLRGIHHMQYDGPAAYTVKTVGSKSTVRYQVKSRVMIDRGTFRRMNPSYEMPTVKSQVTSNNPAPNQWVMPVAPPGSPPFIPHNNNTNMSVPMFHPRSKVPQDDTELELSEDELMLTPAVVYGFSLSDKSWFEFNVEHVHPIAWNDEIFENLVLPNDRKVLLKSLVEAHDSDSGFDDFVHGKGHGLVINLFGPPGVGKTLSAEATSEHVRRPLYVIGSGDLGTYAALLDWSLNRVFNIATAWNAIILIDEADVFLQQRDLYDMERNAMVAVFLRHLEYYRGVIFMTTNRVKVFDEAFLSRIHVALHFTELTKDARKQVWTAFLKKVNVSVPEFGEDLVDMLAEREVNGRQIKNAVRTASSFATSKGVPLSFKHLTDTLDAMEEFTQEVKSVAKQ